MSKRGPLDDPMQEQRNAQKLAERDRQNRDDLRAVLATPAGRRFVFRLLDDRCKVSSVSFTGNSETFYREGRRSVGVELMQIIQEIAPDAWLQALNEEMTVRVKDHMFKEQRNG
jgi:hypothetical protein